MTKLLVIDVLIQEIMELAHSMKLSKGPSRHTCHLFLKQELGVQEELQIMYQVCLGQCKPHPDQRW